MLLKSVYFVFNSESMMLCGKYQCHRNADDFQWLGLGGLYFFIFK